MSFAPDYPVAPANVDPKILEPTSQFKSEVSNVLFALLFFVLVYIALIASSLALAALCVAGGIGLIILKPMLVTIGLGIGLAGLGVMVVVFLVKFIFKRHKADRSGLIEISETDQPRLFEFIRNITKETATVFPKRLYISHDVNASVFYDSSFWSMFLPVRKNLQIGLGLVNCVNVSEFKAILAHEFGHFSQSSMKLGSFVYNMNNIIFNMLYDNDSYERTLESWANASGYFAFFAVLTFRIVKGIQWILQQVYNVVNKQYMKLSRQMEFHADTVAAAVAGGNHLVTSLRRLEVADTTYRNLFTFYEGHFKDALIPDNVYPQHRIIMTEFANVHGLPIEAGLPRIDKNSFTYFNRSRIVIKDQWASHPSTDDRENRLRSLSLETPVRSDPAWTLFDNAENLQQTVTEKLFGEVKFETSPTTVDKANFASRFQAKREEYELTPLYKGFYDSRNISEIDLRGLENTAPHVKDFYDLLTKEALALPYRIGGAHHDIETLRAIAAGNTGLKHFELDGIRYKAKEAAAMQQKLEEELKEFESRLAETNKNIIAFFLSKASATNNLENLRERYSEYFILTSSCDRDVKTSIAMQNCLAPLYQQMPIEQIPAAIAKLKAAEVEFKERLAATINQAESTPLITLDQHKRVTEYLGTDWQYFNGGVYNQPALDLLNESLFIFYHMATEKAFRARKELLEYQVVVSGLERAVGHTQSF